MEKRIPTGTVQIPVHLPGILKEYAKSVLRTQPQDLLAWSAKYFNEIAQSDQRPDPLQESNLREIIDERVKQAYTNNDGSLIDLNGCKNLYSEFSGISRIPVDDLRQWWLSREYSTIQLREILGLGQLYESSIDRDYFCAIICGNLGSTLRETLRFFTEVSSGIDQSNLQMIPYTKLEKVYTFLMKLNSENFDAQTDEILNNFRNLSLTQSGMVTHQNITDATMSELDD